MLWIVDENGQIAATYDSVPYPAPHDVVQRVSSGISEGARLVDVPPLGSAYWHAPNGVPVIKPKIELSADKNVVKADESDAVTLNGVPQGAIITVTDPSGQEVQLPPGDYRQLSFSETGPHVVRVIHPAMQEGRFHVLAEAASSVRRVRRLGVAEGEGRHVVGRRGPLLAAKALALLASEGVPATGAALAAVAQRGEALGVLEGRPSPGIEGMALAGGADPATVARQIVETADAYYAAAAKHEALKSRLAQLSEGGCRKSEVEAAITEAGRADLLPRL